MNRIRTVCFMILCGAMLAGCDEKKPTPAPEVDPGTLPKNTKGGSSSAPKALPVQ